MGSPTRDLRYIFAKIYVVLILLTKRRNVITINSASLTVENMKERIHNMLQDIQPDFEFEEGSDFIKNGYLDSFDVITLVSELEDAFGIAISALDIVPENFASTSAIAALVERSSKRA